ncbi:hypothetical protein Trydic_g21958 [Trypoxylus dichotomus]
MGTNTEKGDTKTNLFNAVISDNGGVTSSFEHVEEGPSSGVCLEPPTGFSDGRVASGIESDRNVNVEKLTSELATHIAGYREKKREETREFTIHV